MKRKLFVAVSLLMVISMLLSACQAATPTTAPEPTKAPQQATEAPAAPTATVAQAEPTKAEPAKVEPTKAPEPTQAPKSTRTGGWLDKIVFSAIADTEPAVAQLEAGTIDMHAVGSDNAAAFEKVKGDANLTYATTYGSSNQLILNTVACPDTKVLNPFTSAPIREAMNWAIDRNYIAQEIMNGLAKPKYTAITSAFPDYARYADAFSAVETKYAFNFDKAKAAVDAEMPKLGAKQGADGKWMFNDKPVTIIGLIRTEDKRKEIGEYFANQLEKLGFTVDRQEKTRKEAGPIWQGDPKECKFGFYTAGWISTAISRDDGNMFVQYNTGKMQNIPLFNAYQPSKDLQDVEDKLFTNAFSNMDERAQLFKKALDLSMTESWWGVWVSDNTSFSPYNKNVVSAYDLAGGFASAQLWPYTIRKAGVEGGELKIAQSGILVQPWNPIAGSNWTDDAMPQRATMDYGTVYDPYTGLSLPKLITKADVVAEKGLPINKTLDWVNISFQDKIAVPDDAWVDWDAAKQVFITAAEKAKADPKWAQTAKTKVTVVYSPDLFKYKWQDGVAMSPADFVFHMIMQFDQGKKESKNYDESLAPGVETFLTHFKGVKIVSTDPLTIETYDDQFALDAENNVSTWFPNQYYPSSFSGGMISYQNLTPALLAEEAGELALSTNKAQAKKIEWTSFVAGPSLPILAKYLDKAIADKYVPFAPTMSQYLKAEDAVAGYTAMKAWYDAKKHFMIGTGPYFVDQVFPVEGTITLSRFADYPDLADKWSVFGAPKIAAASVEGPTSVAAGQEAAFDVYVTTNDQPYPAADIDKVSYTLYNGNGDAVASGTADMVADGQYQVKIAADVTSKLDAGAAKVAIAVSSKVVSIPAFATYEFVVTK